MKRFGLLLMLVACAAPGRGSPDVLDRHHSERVAEELARDGRHDLARDQLEVAAAETEDELRRGELLLERCDILRSERKIDPARRCYLALVQEVTPEQKAEARYRAAAMEVELGRIRRARERLREMIIDQPNTDAAEKGARYLLELSAESGEREAEATKILDALLPQAEFDENTRALCTYLMLVIGEGSSADLERAWMLGSDTHWRDELYLARGKALLAEGALDEAATVLEAFLHDRQTSWFVGSYDSPYLGRGAMLLGEICEELGDRDRAIEAYDWLLDELPKSKYRDDAAYARAVLIGTRDALEEFIATYPDSRFATSAAEALRR
ncbi:MAG: hypothetical protein AAF654_07135 [Myxococcota bacterium]